MNKRVLLILVAAATLFFSALSSWAKDAERDKCCLACTDCQKACLECVAECLERGGRKDCIKACLDCADICEACAKIDAREGPAAKIIATACAAACELCAKECEKDGDESCLACAKKCRSCAKECKANSK
ncbi:MAG TPA: hypothetical protein VG125_12460 [Pirellulales bacterium]|jgi:hypothetical protein|nr:hypothetical protein [Pirellulales bacterium]